MAEAPPSYNYTPVYAAVPASIASFGIQELNAAAGLPDKFEVYGTDMQVLRAFLAVRKSNLRRVRPE